MGADITHVLTHFLKQNQSRDAAFMRIKEAIDTFLIGYKATEGIKASLDNSYAKLNTLKSQCVEALNGSLPSLHDPFTQQNIHDVIHFLAALNFTDHVADVTLKEKIKHTLQQQHIESLLTLSAESDALPKEVKGHILVLDKNPNTRSSLATRLQGEGHTVYFSDSSESTLTLLYDDVLPIDIIMIDNLSFAAFSQELKDYCASDRTHIFVMLLCAGDDSDLITKAFNEGVDDYVVKPINTVLLKARVHSALNRMILHRYRQKKKQEYKEAMEELEHVINDLDDAFLLLDEENNIINYNTKVFDFFPHLQRDKADKNEEDNTTLALKNVNFLTLIQKNIKHHLYDTLIQKTAKTYIKDVEEKLSQNICDWEEKLATGHVLSYRFQTTMENHKIILIKDQSEANLGRHHLAYLAYYDSLTGTVNRQFFIQRLEHIMQDQNNRTPLAILVVDLDGFKEINDTHGHEMGDWILKQVAQRLKASIRQGDIVARFGGDEFTVLLKNIMNEEAIRAIADRMLEAICSDYVRGSITLTVGASMGIACTPSDSESPMDLINHADTAMYSVKQHGKRGLRFYKELVLPRNSVVH
ncbi:MAG: diguanylate cyclase [Alphaproteobacteria bacterium]|nr:diguanylate cyclase [Alphaproteobacteria bacterium]